MEIAFAEWLVAMEPITPRILSLSWIASSRRLRTRVPTPSARQYPSAFSSHVLQPPVGERKLPRLKPAKRSGVVIMLAPPASAMPHSFDFSDRHANWIHNALAEQAASTLALGP